MKSSMNMKANQKGFTLIELVVVIVILGILAVTAAPKFIDLTSDAKGSVVQAVKASLNSAADLAHAKALVKGIPADGSLSIAKATITFVNFYPDKDSINSLMEVDTAASEGDFVLATTVAKTATYSHAKATTQSTCQAKYVEAEADERPKITADVEGC